MVELFFSHGAGWFTLPAAVGTAVFLLRLLMMSLGHVGLDAGGHGDVHLDLGHGADAQGHDDTGQGFKVLSVQALAAFMMGFGWGGLGGLKGAHWEVGTATIVGLLAGGAMVWLLAILLKGVYDLQASGNIPIEAAVGAEGTVYLTVPAAAEEEGETTGLGQVTVVVKGRRRVYSAVSAGPDLATGTRVRVVGVSGESTVVVAGVGT